MDRGTGITTRQMESAPKNAVYVWCNGVLFYPKELAKKIGRTDLEIVSPGRFDGYSFHGRMLSGLVLDHAAKLTDRQWENFKYAMRCVTPKPRDSDSPR